MDFGMLLIRESEGRTNRPVPFSNSTGEVADEDCRRRGLPVSCARMFRPCIDLHEGRVKQIVGGSLDTAELRTNFVSEKSSAWFAELYKRDGLKGGHVIMLGPGNEEAALEALRAYPGGLQLGGGINAENARKYLDTGASHVIVTSWVFRDGRVDWERLNELVTMIGRSRSQRRRRVTRSIWS